MPFESLIGHIEQYLATEPRSDDAPVFERELERWAYEQLYESGRPGWDFECVYPFFGDRGTSILIENVAIPWSTLWHALLEKCGSPPQGAIVNFEIYDNIQQGVKAHKPVIARRLVTSEGVWHLST